MVRFAVAVGTYRNCIRHCVFTAVGQQYAVVYLQIWRAISTPSEWRNRGASFTDPLGSG